MSCYVMVEFTAKPGTGPAVLGALRVALPDTRNKEGCESLDVTVNQDDRDNMLLVMRWTSRKHYQTYRDWPEANGDLTQPYQPSPKGLSGRPAHCPFRGLLRVHSRYVLHTRAVTYS
jgi:quinol monooxygenase YgiN